MNKFKLGVIGCGFMAQAILDGILKNQFISPADLIVSDPVDGKLQKYREIGCRTAKDNRTVAGNSEFLLFAVKPQHLSAWFAGNRRGKRKKNHQYIGWNEKRSVPQSFSGCSRGALYAEYALFDRVRSRRT